MIKTRMSITQVRRMWISRKDCHVNTKVRYFATPAHHTKKNLEEIVIPVTRNVTADCINSINTEGSIGDNVLMRNAAKMIHRKLREKKVKRNWPPTPQDLMQNEMFCNSDLYNLIAWIVDPNAPLGKEGLVKLSKNKELKVMQVSQNIEALLPNS